MGPGRRQPLDSRQLTQLLLVCGASVAALFFNPFGYKLVLYPFDLGFRQQSVVKYMDEWLPVDFSSWNGKLAMLLIFGLLASVLFSRRKWKLAEVVLTAFALWAALSHTRFMFFAGLIIMPILSPRMKLFGPYSPTEKPWLNAAIMAVVAGLMIFFFPSNASLQQKIDAEYPRRPWHLCSRTISTVGFSTSTNSAGIWIGIPPNLNPSLTVAPTSSFITGSSMTSSRQPP